MIKREEIEKYFKLQEELVKLREAESDIDHLWFKIKDEACRVIGVISEYIGLNYIVPFVSEVDKDFVYYGAFDLNKEYPKYQKFDVNEYLNRFPIEWLSIKNNEIKKELKKNFVLPKDINNPFGESKLNKKMENFLNDLSKKEIKALKEYLND